MSKPTLNQTFFRREKLLIYMRICKELNPLEILVDSMEFRRWAYGMLMFSIQVFMQVSQIIHRVCEAGYG